MAPIQGIDLRYNAIESMADFMELISRARQMDQTFQSVMVTPEQVMILEKEVWNTPQPFGGPVRTIMGFEIVVRNQDD